MRTDMRNSVPIYVPISTEAIPIKLTLMKCSNNNRLIFFLNIYRYVTDFKIIVVHLHYDRMFAL